MLTLQTPLSEIHGIAPRFLRNFAKLKILSVKDLLWHFPVRYEDFSEIFPIGELQPGQHGTIQGIIQTIKIRRSFHRRMLIVEALISDDSGTIKATWFNQSYLLNILRPGRRANFSGKVTLGEDGIRLSHPIYELVSSVKGQGSSNDETRHTARLVPIYPETRGLTSKGIRFLTQPILKNIESITEWLPEEVLDTADLLEINEALHTVHFPETIDSTLRAKKRFSFEELFLLQLLNIQQKLKLAREKAPSIKTDVKKLKQILSDLPFELTPSQKKSLWEIIQDLEKPHPMNRLLQGDVGSGKTAVAALAALIASQNGLQTVFMAPTEILARQHFGTLKKLFRGIKTVDQPATALLTSSEAKIFYEIDVETNIKKTALLKKIEDGEIKITIGTHAVIQKNVGFKNLGFVVIDEQHRFGVSQRAALVKHTTQANFLPHLLSMSATPIPRTLMLTVFGDLDISTITELPLGRKPIITKIVAPLNRHKAYQFIREQIKKGRQAFVICPRIEPLTDAERTQTNAEIPRESAFSPRKSALFLETKTVKEEYEKLSQKIFPDLRIAMLHGKMSARVGRDLASGGPTKHKSASETNPTKEKTMKEFQAGTIDILVSTSVVEVGVDVPNATIMMIEGSERFGLAQLYQLRGRVGRGQHQSFCFLFTDSSSKITSDRLNAILEAKNGFELAEKDLKLRGPGEFLGQKQTGLPDIAMRGLQDIELIKQSRTAALQLIQNDNNLKKYPLLVEKLTAFQKKIHQE